MAKCSDGFTAEISFFAANRVSSRRFLRIDCGDAPIGREQREHFTDEIALRDQQVALTAELEQDGWTGLQGWNF